MISSKISVLRLFLEGVVSDEYLQRFDALVEAADELEFALEVFEDTCDCGECRPCQRAVFMREVLEKLK